MYKQNADSEETDVQGHLIFLRRNSMPIIVELKALYVTAPKIIWLSDVLHHNHVYIIVIAAN